MYKKRKLPHIMEVYMDNPTLIGYAAVMVVLSFAIIITYVIPILCVL